MIAINWPLLILTDSPEFSRKLTTAGMVKICRNEAMVTNKRFDGNWGNLYTKNLPHSNIFLLSKYHLFYPEVNLMPYGFLLVCKKLNVILQSVSWILAEFYFNRGLQRLYTGTCIILQKTINGFLCLLIVFLKSKTHQLILKDVIKLNRNLR